MQDAYTQRGLSKAFIPCLAICCVILAAPTGLAADFDRDVLPVLNKYCAGCHKADEAEGGLQLTGFQELMNGGDNGPVVVAGKSSESRLIRLMTGLDEPLMPPDDHPGPTPEEIGRIKRWIEQGGKPSRPSSAVSSSVLVGRPERNGAPSLAPKPITALAYHAPFDALAVARFGSVDLMTPNRQFIQRFSGHPGKINDVRFSSDNRRLVVATGDAGVRGTAWIWELESGHVERTFDGHTDSLYAAVFSPNDEFLATSGYDRRINVWKVANGELVQELSGHNGPVFDLAFHPNSRILASASGDATIKVWDVATGERLDTLSQPLQEQFSVDISSDGKWIVAGGADNRLRLWRLVSLERPRINPLEVVRFGHEQAIHRVRFSGKRSERVVSSAADRTVKIWNTHGLTLRSTVRQDTSASQAFAVDDERARLFLGRMDGSLDVLNVAHGSPRDAAPPDLVEVPTRKSPSVESRSLRADSESGLPNVDEVEPNDSLADAQAVSLPTRISGRIFREDVNNDRDVFRIDAKAGESWIISVNAARDGSSLDSVIRVLDGQGRPVPRVLLQAVRDSYFTFRGKDSRGVGDFRLHNWEEMELNQFLYASGEVVKLFHYPRGPDSGFNVYPNFGNRYGYFDTTPIAHALQEPCYIVEPHPPGTKLPANGLPTFVVNFENDDESQRRFGNDSLLNFTAPSSGEYFVELEDVRRLQADSHKYELTIRPPSPGFSVSEFRGLTVAPGSGRKFRVEIERKDGYTGPIKFDIESPPPGLSVTSPIVVEAGHVYAWGTVTADDDAQIEGDLKLAIHATAEIDGEIRERQVGHLGPIKLADSAKIAIQLGNTEALESMSVIEVVPGTQSTAIIRIQRRDHTGRVGFGKEEALFNAPHGVFVSDTGLNGVLITEDQSERTFRIQAEPWVQPTERWVFVESDVAGNPTSQAVLLRVLPVGRTGSSDAASP